MSARSFYNTARSSQRPLASIHQVIWLAVFAGLAAVSILLQLGVVPIVACFVLMVVGWIPTAEAPLFLWAPRQLKSQWKLFTKGNVYRRSLSSTDFVLRKGVTELKGFFKVQLVVMKFTSSGGKLVEVPTLFTNKKHGVVVKSSTVASAALADNDQRLIIDTKLTNCVADISRDLGIGASFTQWSMTRPVNRAVDYLYYRERLDPAVKAATPEADGVNAVDVDDLYRVHELMDEVHDITWERECGMTLSANRPPSWRSRKLHKLKPKEVLRSKAMSAALQVEKRMRSAGIEGARICSKYDLFQFVREFWNVGARNDIYRIRALNDKVSSEVARQNGKELSDEDAISMDESPLPVMQQELANDYFILDGNYHRVMWITNFYDDAIAPGYFDALHTAECTYFVSVYCEIYDAQKDDVHRQDKRDFAEFVQGLKRRQTASDERQIEHIDQPRYDVINYGAHALYFRVLVVVSGTSYEDMEANQLILEEHLSNHNIRVNFRVVTGGDQLVWFFAALGCSQ